MNEKMFETDGVAKIGVFLIDACKEVGIRQEDAFVLFQTTILELALDDANATGKYKEGTKEDVAAIEAMLGEYYAAALQNLSEIMERADATIH
jgi:hypothetical protein